MSQLVQAKIWADICIKNHKNVFCSLILGKSGLSYRTELLIEEYGAINNDDYYEIDGLAALFLIKRAKVDLFAVNAIRKIISQNITKDKKIPQCWRELHSSLVRGTFEKPSKNKRYETKDWRNFIAKLIAMILMERYNLPFSSNHADQSGKSALEITLLVMMKNKIINVMEVTSLERGIRRLP